MSQIPQSLKSFQPFVKRAEELEKKPDSASQTVGYYCRLHVVSSGLQAAGGDKNAEAFVISQMDVLERLKPNIDKDKNKCFQICSNYALAVFKQADEETKNGLADKGSAKLFYAAGTFFDILYQFKDQDLTGVEEMKKYAKWKATDILQCLKSGTTPEGSFWEEEVVVEKDC